MSSSSDNEAGKHEKFKADCLAIRIRHLSGHCETVFTGEVGLAIGFLCGVLLPLAFMKPATDT